MLLLQNFIHKKIRIFHFVIIFEIFCLTPQNLCFEKTLFLERHSYAENYSKSIISFLEEKASGIVANKTKQ